LSGKRKLTTPLSDNFEADGIVIRQGSQ